jgi:hypothetical protein
MSVLQVSPSATNNSFDAFDFQDDEKYIDNMNDVFKVSTFY